MRKAKRPDSTVCQAVSDAFPKNASDQSSDAHSARSACRGADAFAAVQSRV